MPELTLRDYLSLLGLALVIFAGIRWVKLIRYRKERDKDGFRAFLVGRLIADKVLDQIRPFRSQSEAVIFVAKLVDKYKYAYAAQNGHVVIDNLEVLCRNILKDLRVYGFKLYFSSR